jgi:nitrate reductase cytochrome c-type subunit
MRSPGLEQKAFASELPTMEETREEHEARRERQNSQPAQQQKYVYNPQDYARAQMQYAPAPPYVPHAGQQGQYQQR